MSNEEFRNMFKNSSAADNVNHAILLTSDISKDGDKTYSLALALHQQLKEIELEIDCNLVNLSEILLDLLGKAGDINSLDDCLKVLQTQVQK